MVKGATTEEPKTRGMRPDHPFNMLSKTLTMLRKLNAAKANKLIDKFLAEAKQELSEVLS